jgi:upstream activation factor subunit UAF30
MFAIDILKSSDMETVSAKSVRKQLEVINGCSYNDKKKEIDALIIEIYEAMLEDDKDSSEEDQPLASQKSHTKKSRDKDEEYEAYVMKPSPSKRKSLSKSKAVEEKPAKKKKTRNPSSTGRGAPNNGFMKPLKLSPAIQVLTRSEHDEVM